MIATDPHTGKRLFITRIPSENQFPFHLRRMQFHSKLTFFPLRLIILRTRLWLKSVCFYASPCLRMTYGVSRWIGQNIQQIWNPFVKKQFDYLQIYFVRTSPRICYINIYIYIVQQDPLNSLALSSIMNKT